MGDLTSFPPPFGSEAAGASIAGEGSAGVGCAAPIIGGASIGAMTAGGATCMAPRPLGLFEIRIFIPLSDEISIESTVDSSRMSMSFLT